jgi:fructose 1,6-bisphosphate aldolase/phosphatase
MEMADYLRKIGPFQPHRLGDNEMEYTTLPKVLKSCENRFTEEEIVPKGEIKDTSDSAE